MRKPGACTSALSQVIRNRYGETHVHLKLSRGGWPSADITTVCYDEVAPPKDCRVDEVIE